MMTWPRLFLCFSKYLIKFYVQNLIYSLFHKIVEKELFIQRTDLHLLYISLLFIKFILWGHCNKCIHLIFFRVKSKTNGKSFLSQIPSCSLQIRKYNKENHHFYCTSVQLQSHSTFSWIFHHFIKKNLQFGKRIIQMTTKVLVWLLVTSNSYKCIFKNLDLNFEILSNLYRINMQPTTHLNWIIILFNWLLLISSSDEPYNPIGFN